MLAVMVVYLHRQRHIRVCGEVRRTHRRKLQQFRNVLVRRVPISNELVIVHKEMNDFACLVFCCVMVIHRDKFAMRICLDRLDLRNVVLSNAGECELVEIFKVNHTGRHVPLRLLVLRYFLPFTVTSNAPDFCAVTKALENALFSAALRFLLDWSRNFRM